MIMVNLSIFTGPIRASFLQVVSYLLYDKMIDFGFISTTTMPGRNGS